MPPDQFGTVPDCGRGRRRKPGRFHISPSFVPKSQLINDPTASITNHPDSGDQMIPIGLTPEASASFQSAARRPSHPHQRARHYRLVLAWALTQGTLRNTVASTHIHTHEPIRPGQVRAYPRWSSYSADGTPTVSGQGPRTALLVTLEERGSATVERSGSAGCDRGLGSWDVTSLPFGELISMYAADDRELDNSSDTDPVGVLDPEKHLRIDGVGDRFQPILFGLSLHADRVSSNQTRAARPDRRGRSPVAMLKRLQENLCPISIQPQKQIHDHALKLLYRLASRQARSSSALKSTSS